jgi:hypothetical protein
VGGGELHRPLELGAAVAAQGVQGVACQELRADADEGGASYSAIVLDGTLLQLRLGTAPEDLAPRIRLDGETVRR